MTAERPYDIILFGATGFTGQLTADYLLKQKTPVRLALAGRSAEKLREVLAALVVDNPGVAKPDVLLADSHDPASLQTLCAQARVIISTVGPYLQHGEALVAACVTQGCDYVDLTGEPQFVSNMQQRYGDAARAKGVKIVHCCGFDSIPHDLGVFFTIQELNRRLGAERMQGAKVQVKGYVRGHGDISGGTWNSAINAMPDWQQFLRERHRLRKQKAHGRIIRLAEKPELRRLQDGWATPMPTIDPAVVVQSATRYTSYGQEFSYSHYAVVPQLSRIVLTGMALSGIFTLSQFAGGRRWLGKRRPSGVGPAPEDRARHWFTVDFVAEVGTPKPAMVLHTQVRGGDPGYDETAKMLAQSALCLLQDKNALPPHYGIVTPAEAMGAHLLARLQKAGMEFAVKS